MIGLASRVPKVEGVPVGTVSTIKATTPPAKAPASLPTPLTPRQREEERVDGFRDGLTAVAKNIQKLTDILTAASKVVDDRTQAETAAEEAFISDSGEANTIALLAARLHLEKARGKQSEAERNLAKATDEETREKVHLAGALKSLDRAKVVEGNAAHESDIENEIATGFKALLLFCTSMSNVRALTDVENLKTAPHADADLPLRDGTFAAGCLADLLHKSGGTLTTSNPHELIWAFDRSTLQPEKTSKDYRMARLILETAISSLEQGELNPRGRGDLRKVADAFRICRSGRGAAEELERRAKIEGAEIAAEHHKAHLERLAKMAAEDSERMRFLPLVKPSSATKSNGVAAFVPPIPEGAFVRPDGVSALPDGAFDVVNGQAVQEDSLKGIE